jgi:hypothetical protein
MVTIGKRLLGLLLWVLVAAIPLACGNANEGLREERSTTTVDVGGNKGVVVDRSNYGTEVKVGGDKGVVVEHPRD